MTDTTILDALMETLERNPLTAERLGNLGPKHVPEGSEHGTALQFRVTDRTPFYANREAVRTAEMNRRYAEQVEAFHDDITAPRMERPRIGSCNRVIVTERHIDGEVWRKEERCGGIVHAVETRISQPHAAIRVDGRCLTCGWEVHRAGRLYEKG